MNYNEALSCLNGYTKSGKPITDLSRFKGLMYKLGNVQVKLKYLHIAGTNGKGSVSEYTALALEYAGYKTGKFTSPYINRVEERIQINGEPVSESDFAFYIGKANEAAEETGCTDYSQFEILTAAAFMYFYAEKCDYVVLETGIGGLLDCSNIIVPEISIITTVDLDHCGILGDTVEKIARHKAGIIKPNIPAVFAPFQYEDVKRVIREKAAETGSELIIPEESGLRLIGADLSGTKFAYKGKEFRTGMCGKHQMINAAAAIEALRKLGISEICIERALENAAVPARMEKVRDFLIDGAHNVSGARAAAEVIKGVKGRKALVVGMLRSKDYQGALGAIVPCVDYVTAVDFFAEDAVKAEEIVEIAKGFGCEAETAGSAGEAIEAARRVNAELRVVCGSLYLCGAVRGELKKEERCGGTIKG